MHAIFFDVIVVMGSYLTNPHFGEFSHPSDHEHFDNSYSMYKLTECRCEVMRDLSLIVKEKDHRPTAIAIAIARDFVERRG